MTFTKGQIFRYIALPAILPRIKELFGSGFSHVAFFIAHIYKAARLLPAYHPYLNPVNIGRFGIYHVINEAAKSLEFKKENSDQIIIFFVILLGLLILAGQFIMLLFGMLFVSSAQASPGIPIDFFDFFKANQSTDHDIAFVLLDMVFGVPDFFNTCVSKTTPIPCFEKGGNNIVSQLPGNNMVPYEAYSDYDRSKSVGAYPFPTPFHLALRSMMQLYSIGLLVIAVMLFLYFMVAVIAETAQEGTPFGKRFNKVWAPLRMVVALGLLIPIANGLNSGQYLVLYAAKFGSNFATNGWIIFTDTVVTGTNTLLGDRSDLVVTPQTPQIGHLVEFFTVLAACVRAEAIVNKRLVEAYHVKPDKGAGTIRAPALTGSNFANALNFYENRDIKIVFGTYEVRSDGQPRGTYLQGGVDPVCGEIILPVPSINPTDSPGAWLITQQFYENFLTPIWAETITGYTLANPINPTATTPLLLSQIGSNMVLRSIIAANKPAFTSIAPADAQDPTASDLQAIIDSYRIFGFTALGFTGIGIEDIIANGVAETINNGNWLYDLNSLGWGGAGIWYNKLSQLNGALISTSFKLPFVKEYPKLMKKVEDIRQANEATLTGYDRFKPYISEEQDIENQQEGDLGMQIAMYRSQKIWEDVYTTSTTNFLIDAIIAVFGLEGLFNMVNNTDVHPLAQLVGIGKGLVESSIRNLGFAFASTVGAAVIPVFGPILNVAGSFSASIGMIGLGVGFVLFYIIPFLPFIYFFFAVGGWVKGIFEAMVGVPLWALAHIRIDGNGLPGDAAMGGYYLILEIFLRPILIIFGLLASIAIFSAQVKILNEIWSLVTTNLTGFDNKTAKGVAKGMTGAVEYMRGHVDRFFFTVIYAIIVYLLAVASFKLVTLIPNNIMRWMGANVQTFGDQSDDPAQNLVRNTMLGSNIVTQNMGGSFNRLRGAMSASSSGGGS